jgi:hypothetical protein
MLNKELVTEDGHCGSGFAGFVRLNLIVAGSEQTYDGKLRLGQRARANTIPAS